MLTWYPELNIYQVRTCTEEFYFVALLSGWFNFILLLKIDFWGTDIDIVKDTVREFWRQRLWKIRILSVGLLSNSNGSGTSRWPTRTLWSPFEHHLSWWSLLCRGWSFVLEITLLSFDWKHRKIIFWPWYHTSVLGILILSCYCRVDSIEGEDSSR